MTEQRAGLPVLAFTTATAFETWLAQQPAVAQGLWLKLAKKSAGVACVTKPLAIAAASAIHVVNTR